MSLKEKLRENQTICVPVSALYVIQDISCKIRPKSLIINTLRPKQNGHCFPDDVFKCIFMNENIWISIQISRKFVPKDPINNIPALVQIMAWHWPGDKSLSEPMIAQFTDEYMRHSASMCEEDWAGTFIAPVDAYLFHRSGPSAGNSDWISTF